MAGEKKKPETHSGEGAHDDVDALFRLPLSEFTAARNALAARMKKAGDAEDANRVKALPKPSVAAWTANQLYWKHRVLFDRLLDSGERFRKAQTTQLEGKSADVRTPLEARRAVLSELTSHAAKILTHAGSVVSPDTMRRVTTTLEALSTYAGLPDAPQPGRLTDDIQPPGFEALAALVPQVGRTGRAAGPPRVIPFQATKAKPAAKKAAGADDEKARAAERKAQIAAAKAALQDAERTLRDARKTAQRAEEDLKKAAARSKEAETAKAQAEKQLEQAAAEADDARKKARAVAADAEEAAQAVADAERALDNALSALKSMNDD